MILLLFSFVSSSSKSPNASPYFPSLPFLTKMATFSSSSLLLLLFLLFAGVAHARPCKTILLSYYYFSSSSDAGADHAHAHALLPFPGAVPRNPSQVFILSDLRGAGRRLPRLSVLPAHPADRPAAGRGPDAFSLALTIILGVACGALAAATVYLVLVVIGAPGAHCFEDEGEEEEGSVKAPGGYAKMPAGPVKEGYEVNT